MRTIEDKLLDYLREHKKPVTTNQMAKYYIVSEGSVQRAFSNLVKREIVQVVPESKPYLFRIK